MATEAVQAILETADRTYTQVRNNPNLSDEAKRKAIAAAYLKAKTAVETSRADGETTNANRIQTLSRNLFGLSAGATPTDTANLRDARDRVANISQPSAAIAALNQAELIGDTSMTRAILGAAYSYNWSDVIDAYLGNHPNDQAAAQELWDLNLQAANANPFIYGIAWIVPTLPELVGLTDWKLSEVASGATASIQVLS